MKKFIFIFCYIIPGLELNGQFTNENLTGHVSFLSSQNIYVKFKSTSGIFTGDTLYMSSNGILIPVLTVNNLSSSSCVCSIISSANLTIADLIIAKTKIEYTKPEDKIAVNVIKEIPKVDSLASISEVRINENELKQKIRGNISAYSYSDFSNTKNSDSQRFRYTLSIDARNIGSSKLSAESYISFRHKKGEWNEVNKNVFNALKIYNLAFRYDLNKTTQLSLGRKINPKISSIGAMDGIQAEKSFNRFALGGIIGSRPDYSNYGFDINLFQYGAYLMYNYNTSDIFYESSLAFMQQSNHSKTDRRFLYFQHSNSIVKNLYFFGTFELDLYKLKNNLPQNTFNLTGLYISLRYKMTNKLTISGSYDARKNVMYYETYKTLIDSILENQMRQGVRLQSNYRISKNMIFGMHTAYRFLRSDPQPSKNIYSYFTYSQLPGLNASITVSGTLLGSSFLNGKMLAINVSRDFFQGKVQTILGYRYVDYNQAENLLDITQNIGEMNISWYFYNNMSLSVDFESTFEPKNKYNRIYLQIRKRF